MAIFDPSKLDIDFSDTSDLSDIEKDKIAENKAKENQESQDKTNKASEIPKDVLGEIKNEKDTINLDKNKDIEDAKYHNKSEDVHIKVNSKQDTEKLATIITDAELIEKDKEIKEFKKQKEEEKYKWNNNQKRIDINLIKLNDLLSILLREKYDYFKIEPAEYEVKITFVKDTIDKEITYITYPIYSRLLIEIKKAGNLKLDVTESEQKGKGKYNFLDRQYSTIVKTKANNFWESVYFKASETAVTAGKKKKETISVSKILWFLVAMLLAVLIIGGLFLWFILFNSNTLGDLKFFNDLWIEVDRVREFVAMLVNVIFFTIVFILTAFSVTYIFKAILTKKEFKKKKTSAAVLAIFFLIITLISGFLWLSLSKKVAELKSANYGNPVIYDNTLLLSNFYESERDAIVQSTEIIWPIELKFDISEFLNKLKDDGNTVQKITWVFDWEEIERSSDSDEFIRKYDTVWGKNVELIIDTKNLEWEDEEIRKEIATFDINYVVDINEKTTQSGWKIYSFNARSLSAEWKIEWYYIPDISTLNWIEKQEKIMEALSNPILEGPSFSPQEVLFEKEIIVWMFVNKKWQTSNALDKIFIIWWVWESDIDGKINVNPSVKWDLYYEFYLSELDNSFWNGFIETVIWEIDGKEFEKSIDVSDIKNSSKIEFSFKEYWDNRITANLIDSNGNRKVIQKDVKINKLLSLKNGLSISYWEENTKIGRHNSKTFEYNINSLATPTTLKFDARNVSATNQLYALKKVEWDFDSDGNTDEEGKLVEHKIETTGDHHITVQYTFEHRTAKWSSIEMKEDIYIDSEKKDVILNLEIEKASNYVPLIVRFDASRSQVQWDDIERFIYDYGDGTAPEARDAINPGHKYLKAWDYTVKLTVKTKKWKEYSISKELNLLDRPQEIVISSSLKRTKTFQDINFWSEKSNGQISAYYWDFGDGEYSTIANPTKSFSKPWKYKVILRWTFENNNVEEDEVIITIE